MPHFAPYPDGDYDVVGTAEAAAYLGISTTRVVQLSNEGKLEFLRAPYGRVFTIDELERAAAERAELAKTDWRVTVPPSREEG